MEAKKAMGWAVCITVLIVGSLVVGQFFDGRRNGRNGSDRPTQPIYPSESQPWVLEVTDRPTDLPIIVPAGRRLVFRTVNGQNVSVRDRSWDHWVDIVPGRRIRAQYQFTHPQAKAMDGESAYVYYFLR